MNNIKHFNPFDSVDKSMKHNDSNPIMVSVECLVFNHRDYLRNCLDGIVMQIVNFRFEAIVHDDASTDGSSDIILEYAQKYPDIIKPIIEKENQYSKHDGSLRRIVESHLVGKYVALCEGDDYWVDPYKLQKQVDFLENHPDYGLCFTDFDMKYEDKNVIINSVFKKLPDKYPTNYSLEDWIINAGYVAPMTWLVKRELWLNIPDIKTPDGTFVRYASYLYRTNIHFIDEPTSVYRVLRESASHTTSLPKDYERYKSIFYTKMALIDLYVKQDKKQSLIDNLKTQYYIRGLKLFVVFNDKDEIKEAKSFLRQPDLSLKLLFLVSELSIVRKILFFLYKSYKKLF